LANVAGSGVFAPLVGVILVSMLNRTGCALAFANVASMLRVHDVREVREGMLVTAAILAAGA
jgi:hypothetical protein